MLGAQQMQSLPEFFADIPDPRSAQGRRHRLATVLAIAAGAILRGISGYTRRENKITPEWLFTAALSESLTPRLKIRIIIQTIKKIKVGPAPPESAVLTL